MESFLEHMYVYGVISDIITIIERHEEDWIKRVSNIFSSRDFDEAMRKLMQVLLISL